MAIGDQMYQRNDDLPATSAVPEQVQTMHHPSDNTQVLYTKILGGQVLNQGEVVDVHTAVT